MHIYRHYLKSKVKSKKKKNAKTKIITSKKLATTWVAFKPTASPPRWKTGVWKEEFLKNYVIFCCKSSQKSCNSLAAHI